MIPLRPRLRNHDRQIRLSRNRRRVHIIENEAEITPQHLVSDLLLRIGKVKLHLRVSITYIMTSALRVIDLPMIVDLPQNPFHVSVVRLDDGRGERSIDLLQPEIDLIISTPADSYNLVFVAENGRAEQTRRRVPRLH